LVKLEPETPHIFATGSFLEMNVESYRRRAALDPKRGPGRPPTHATIKEKR